MGKPRSSTKEWTKLQKLVNENKRLKREIAMYRKKVSRMEDNQFENTEAEINDFESSFPIPSAQDQLEGLKREWACKKCSEGVLEIVIFNKVNDRYYLRACNSCQHRTRSQKYHSAVKGIVRKEPDGNE
jgi:hypothetical protein